MIGIAAIAVAALFALEPAGVQSPPPNAIGTARIQGTVIDGQRVPVANAIVTLTGTGVGAGRAAVSDASGRFVFDRLPAGRVLLASTKPSYLKAVFGATAPGGTGTPIAVADGQQILDVVLTMPHGGAISGVVRDSRGDPVPGLQITVTRADDMNLRVSAADRIFTDDRGAFRAYGLLPDSYVVAASLGATGGAGGVGVMSAAEVDAALAGLRARAAPGAALPRTERSLTSIVRPTRTFNPAVIFYPGVAMAAAATPITLGLSEDRSGIDFVFQLVRVATVSGIVSGAGGAAVSLTLSPEGGPTLPPGVFGGGSPSTPQPRSSNSDGPFAFLNVLPGRYTVAAATSGLTPEQQRIAQQVAVGLLPADRAPVPGEDSSLYGEATVDVVDDDVSNVFLSLSPAARLTGRVVFPTGTPPSSALFRLRLVRPLRPSAPNANDAASPTALVRPDGTFDFASVRPGSYRLTAMTPPPGWLPATALVNGRDALDVPFTVGPANASPIELTMTDRHASLTGRLVEASGAPATGYFVVIFSTDRDTWLPESRRMRSARPGTDGTFRFEDVVPGEYYLAALTDADSAAWQAPAFLLDAAAAAVKVTIADGGRATQDLRVGR